MWGEMLPNATPDEENDIPNNKPIQAPVTAVRAEEDDIDPADAPDSELAKDHLMLSVNVSGNKKPVPDDTKPDISKEDLNLDDKQDILTVDDSDNQEPEEYVMLTDNETDSKNTPANDTKVDTVGFELADTDNIAVKVFNETDSKNKSPNEIILDTGSKQADTANKKLTPDDDKTVNSQHVIKPKEEEEDDSSILIVEEMTGVKKTRWRADGRCGKIFVADDMKTSPAECNGFGSKPCCAYQTGTCGSTEEECTCKGCIDYRRNSK